MEGSLQLEGKLNGGVLKLEGRLNGGLFTTGGQVTWRGVYNWRAG